MNIQLPKDHGRSLLDKHLADSRERVAKDRKDVILPQTPVNVKDIFDRSDKRADKETDKTDLQKKDGSNSIQAGGLNISFQFDLFYELTSKVQAKMGQDGANRFMELSGKVSETFMGNFSLEIDPVGSFMNGTDKSLEISPETTSEFFDAVEGLADLSPEALENFLKESDEFFAELETTYGEADGTFDQIKGMMQEQAKAFFADVDNARSSMFGAGESQEAVPESEAATLPAADATSLLPATGSASDDSESSLIEMFFKPELKVSQSDYQSFLEEFMNFAEKFKQQMFEKLLGNRNPYEKAVKSEDSSNDSSKSLIDTAI